MIIDIVISLSWSKSLQVVGAGVEVPVAVLLHQHYTQGHKRGISHYEEWEVCVGVTEDQAFEEGFLEGQERGFVIRKPLPTSVLLCQEEEGLNDVGKVRDELSVEVAEAHERAYCTNRRRRLPVIDGRKFDWV